MGTWQWSSPGTQASLSLQRQGRCDTYATEFDLEAEEYVPLPKGDVHKKKEIIQDVTLHDLDVANARPQVPPAATAGKPALLAALLAREPFVCCRLRDELPVLLPLLRAGSPFLSVMFSN